MPVYTSEALILRTYKLGESDRIVVFLTRDRGKKRGVARGARRPRSRYTGALEPMTRAGVAYYEREQRDLVRLNYVEPVASPLSAIGSSSASAATFGHVGYFAELIDEWCPDSHADERLYRLGSAMVDALTAGAPIERLARYFEYWLMRLQGVYPSVTICASCGCPLEKGAMMPPREGMFVCRNCAPSTGGTELSSGALGFLKASSRTSPQRVDRLTLEPRAARELETAHRRLLNAHLDKELKSVRVLRELGR